MRDQVVHAAGWAVVVVIAVAGLATECDREPAVVVPAQHGPVSPAQIKTR